MLAAAPRRILMDHPRRIRLGPWPLVARHRPQAAGLGLAAPRVENPNRDLVQTRIVRCLQRLLQALIYGARMERRLADPAGPVGRPGVERSSSRPERA